MNLRHALLLTIFSFFTYQTAIADPCAGFLGKVDPMGAMAVTMDEMQARQDIAQLDEHANSDDGDAQWKRKDAADIMERAADHHQMETGKYAEGIGKAIAQGDMLTANMLGICVGRRSGQASVDRAAARPTEAAGIQAAQDPNTGTQIASGDAQIIRLGDVPDMPVRYGDVPTLPQ